MATKQIVVGTDGSTTATEAVRRAVELATAQGARLHVVTAYRPKGGRAEGTLPEAWQWKASPGEVAEQTARAAAETATAAGIDVECHAQPGDPADVLVDVVEEVGADLLVIDGERAISVLGQRILRARR